MAGVTLIETGNLPAAQSAPQDSLLVPEERQLIDERRLEVLLVVECAGTVRQVRVRIAHEVIRLAVLPRGGGAAEQIRAFVHQLRPGETELELQPVAEALLHLG